MSDKIQTVAYQARLAALSRPCVNRPCDQEFPEMPSRWCSGCVIAALLRQHEQMDRLLTNALCQLGEIRDTNDRIMDELGMCATERLAREVAKS